MRREMILSSTLASSPATVPAGPVQPRSSLSWLLLAMLAGWSASASPPPANDDCATPTVVAAWPFTDTLDTTGATTAPTDPLHKCSSSKDFNSVWYSFSVSSRATVAVDPSGTTYGIDVAVYTGSCGAFKDVACEYLPLASPFSFTAEAGITYLIEVTDDYGDGGGGGILHLSLNYLHWEFKALPNGDRGVTQISIDPDDEDLWYVSSAANGLYITRTGGNTWEQHLKGNTRALCIDPTHPNIVYAGSFAPSSYNDLYRSDNKGQSWTLIKTFPTALAIYSLLVSAIDCSLFVGMHWDLQPGNGMYKATNHGLTWQFYPFDIPPLPYNQHMWLIIWDIAEDPGNGFLYAATEVSSKPTLCLPGCYDPPTLRSKDGGQTWQDVSGKLGGPVSLEWHATQIQVHPVTHEVYFQEEGRLVFVSTDFGDSWQKLPSSMNSGWDLIIDHKYPTRFFGGGRDGHVRLSMDTGRSFTVVGPPGPGGDFTVHVALNSKSTRLCASYGGLDQPGGIYVADLIERPFKRAHVGIRSWITFVPVCDVRLFWNSASNLIYQVQYRSELDGNVWLDLGRPMAATGSSMNVTEVVGQSRRFFRVLGPDMVWIPAGTFLMGSPPTEPARDSDEDPQTAVTISRGFWIGRHEVTQAEYLDVMRTNPSYFNGMPYPGGPDYGVDLKRPVEKVSWIDATNYCGVLTERERLAGRLPAGYVYRLPTEAEWEYACRAETTTVFHYGNDLRSGMANFDSQYEYPPCGDSRLWCYNPSGTTLERTTAVGSYGPNAWGLYDMHGNVWEWCLDWYGPYCGGSVTDPTGPASGSHRVDRGGCWNNPGVYCRSADRGGGIPDWNYETGGFRVVLARPLVVAITNMIFIPAGTFTMGSPPTEAVRDNDEGPQTVVTISRGFWMGQYEVTQAEYVDVMGINPSRFTDDLNRPVEQVSWMDATNYCAQLSERERLAGRLPAGYVYRLPTEAEWEYACRAGTTTVFHYGNDLRSGMSNFDGRYEYPPCGGSTLYCYNPSGIHLDRATAVGSYAPNAWGLYDMHGNVWEWCLDWYGPYSGGSVTDPTGPASGADRVFRGACWNSHGWLCRSASRYAHPPELRTDSLGFRVVLAAIP
jgi:formylglycine-generating enzyme required for sulfatase activity/photosystem II stability/assembly factor-like uncharacterized protein